MSLIRPGAKKELKRWAEPMLAVVVAGLGLWWGLTSFGIVKWLGLGLCVLGGVFIVLGIRRARFGTGSDGTGYVEVDEGAISYFTADGGGALPVGAIEKVALVQSVDGARAWLLTAPGLYPLHIPTDASGAEVLFDVFANLPGLDMQGLLRALNRRGDGDVVIWQRKAAPLH